MYYKLYVLRECCRKVFQPTTTYMHIAHRDSGLTALYMCACAYKIYSFAIPKHQQQREQRNWAYESTVIPLWMYVLERCKHFRMIFFSQSSHHPWCMVLAWYFHLNRSIQLFDFCHFVVITVKFAITFCVYHILILWVVPIHHLFWPRLRLAISNLSKWMAFSSLVWFFMFFSFFINRRYSASFSFKLYERTDWKWIDCFQWCAISRYE